MSLAFFPYLSLKKGDVVSILGSGGKTTLMFLLAQELAQKGFRVITTTTTKIFPPLPSQSSRLLVFEMEQANFIKKIQNLLKKENHLTITKKYIGPKLKGLSPEFINKLANQKIADIILIEADGARGLPLKAPNENEPVIPSSTTWALAVIGIDGIGKTNTGQYVFRPQYFSHLTGINIGEAITPQSVSKIILHPEGLFRGAPPKTKLGVILNKGELPDCLETGKKTAALVIKAGRNSINKVFITSLLPVPKIMATFNL